MKTHMMLLDTAMVALAFVIVFQLFVVMAHHNSLNMLSALPNEFLYLKGMTTFLF